jgi:hypothetical protein
MKKIIAITAMAATMAAAAMAVDVSSMIQLDGDVLNVTTGDSGTVKFLELTEYDPSGDSDYLWKLSVAGEKAGAEIWSWKLDGSVSSKKLWFKPIEAVKFTLGNVGGQSIAFPNFGWWAQTAQNYAYGYMAEITAGSLAVKVALEPGAGAYWIDPSATKVIGGKIGGTWVDATYDLGEIGKVQAYATINGTIGAHGYSNWATSPLAIGVAYAKMPWAQTGFYGDAAVSFKYDGDNLVFQGVDSQIGGQVALLDGALLIQETNLIQYRDAFKFGFEAKASYSLGAITPWVQIDGYSIMDSAMQINLGLDTSVGECSISASVAVPMDFDSYSFSFSVPVQFKVNL